MLNSVLGAISADMAIDLGSSHTRIAVVGRGVVSCQSSYVAILEDRDGDRRILAIGDEARRMVGRTPADIRVVQPVRDGSIEDYEVVEALIRYLMVEVQGRRLWVGPRVAVTIPYGMTDMEKRAVREAIEASGARTVLLVERPIAAGLGSDLPVHEARGHMVVDIGGGTTTVSVLSLAGIVYCRSVQVGGLHMDDAVVQHVRDHHGVLIARTMAESLKHQVGWAVPPPYDATATARGRNLHTGFPEIFEVSAHEVHEALADPVGRISQAIISSLERIPPDLASDVAEMGVVVTGGSALLQGLDRALGEATGLPVVVPENPVCSVVVGAARYLADAHLASRAAGRAAM